jgi:hypothetical protein
VNEEEEGPQKQPKGVKKSVMKRWMQIVMGRKGEGDEEMYGVKCIM